MNKYNIYIYVMHTLMIAFPFASHSYSASDALGGDLHSLTYTYSPLTLLRKCPPVELEEVISAGKPERIRPLKASDFSLVLLEKVCGKERGYIMLQDHLFNPIKCFMTETFAGYCAIKMILVNNVSPLFKTKKDRDAAARKAIANRENEYKKQIATFKRRLSAYFKKTYYVHHINGGSFTYVIATQYGGSYSIDELSERIIEICNQENYYLCDCDRSELHQSMVMRAKLEAVSPITTSESIDGSDKTFSDDENLISAELAVSVSSSGSDKSDVTTHSCIKSGITDAAVSDENSLGVSQSNNKRQRTK